MSAMASIFGRPIGSCTKSDLSLRRPSGSRVFSGSRVLKNMNLVVRAIAACFLSASLLATAEVHAQERSPSAADALFESAKDAMARGDFPRGVYLLLKAPSASSAPSARQGAVTLHPEVGPQAAGLTLTGGF